MGILLWKHFLNTKMSENVKLPKSISELQKLVLEKKTSIVELVDSYLGIIGASNNDLNAFITVTDDYAYAKAKSLDSLVNKSSMTDKPLFGVVVSVKDLYLTKGLRTTAGSKVLESYIPQYSATVVGKLEEAGAVIIGKTNLDAWGHGSSGENSDFGPTKNPWNKNFVPGGSSSGSAVSVAAGMSLISTGTDTGGSIRLPASFTGVYGLKPTYGSVSRYGVIAMSSSLDSIGHFATNVSDLEKVFKVTRGVDGYDANLSTGKFNSSKKNTYRIGIPREYFVQGLDTQVRERIEDVIGQLSSLGFEFEEVSLPHTQYAIAVYYIIMPAEVSSNLARFDGVRYGSKRSAFNAEAKRRIMLGSHVLSAGYYDAYYLKAMKVRSLIVQDFDKVFKKVDALITPVSPTPPFRLGEKMKDPLQMYLSDILTVGPSLAGLPAISVPCGFTQDNLPIGFQLIGQRFSESVLFDISGEYETSLNWKFKSPTL